MADSLSEQEKAERLAKEQMSRRTLLMKLGIALNGLIATAIAIPVIGYLFGPVRRKGAYNSWIELGAVESYPEGETRLASYRNPFTRPWDGETGNVACWVRRLEANQFQVFAINCAHLGCPVRWFPQSQLFMCPCHGGVYYADGTRASGPPERGLFEYRYRVEKGKLMIDAGQMPTLSNDARLVKGIEPCAGTRRSTAG
ncbi:MAG: Rieske 2Fe-2S domain-containing protein [Acidobacteria bacterium]|nr:Rieske 2Fe-2S domain-containing protein [Acidobacteriota bacterium]MBV9147268.1 Rieske 2Fe-2S domain-containing protein [Acidobacteriota bacterium]MBV9436409.1 Rieske 2Fe-2S domain-containing protein [Acidobacteriota bacterium]